MVREKFLTVYTDGSSIQSPRRGGIGIRYITIDADGNEVAENDEVLGYEGATNNQMELLACIKGVEGALDHPSIDTVDGICIATDSRYVTDNVDRAKFTWCKSRWCNRDGRPIENADLWKRLVRLLQRSRKPVLFEWVKGHSKDQHNKAVDKLAKQSAKGFLQRPLRPTTVRRKITSAKVQAGCIPMKGQTLAIRVVTDTYMRTQRLFKYKYEVLPDSGEHSGKVDFIYHETNECLRAGHHYEIRVNREIKNPRIEEVIREIERKTPENENEPRKL